jgi:hypothetical protein
MSCDGDTISLWETSSDEGRPPSPASIANRPLMPSIAELDEQYKSINDTIKELSAQGLQGLNSYADATQVPRELNGSIGLKDDTTTMKVEAVSRAMNIKATTEWANGIPQFGSTGGLVSNPPRVVQMPEWLAILQLMAVQLPELSRIADELELIGQGYYYSQRDALLTEMAGEWIKANIGPVDVQIMTSRISSLKDKIGSRTHVKGGEAIEVCTLLPVRFFRSRVVSVLKDDLEAMALKILASDPEIPSHSVIDIGRGRDPYHIRGIGGTWNKIKVAILTLRTKTKPWLT